MRNNKNNTSSIFIFLLTLSLSSCKFTNEKPIVEPERQWVYIELVTQSKKDTTDYFYYGQIKKSLIKEIDLHEDKKGLFMLSNVRYINDDDLLQLYEDSNLDGNLMFKIQDIEEVVLYKDDPVNFFDTKELHESAIAIRNKQK
tara:strand:- start:37481 stop:37909 length:429 start_codon:yes stop_codon:yes gene_type:complete